MVKPSVKTWAVKKESFRLWFTMIYPVTKARLTFPLSKCIIGALLPLFASMMKW